MSGERKPAEPGVPFVPDLEPAPVPEPVEPVMPHVAEPAEPEPAPEPEPDKPAGGKRHG